VSDNFLAGEGEMARRIRTHEWRRTSLGAPSVWPQALRTAVRLILNCAHPMYIFWGAAGTCFYNDAYRQSIGDERHPSSLGQPAREVWEEIWDIIGPQFEQVMAGRGATWHKNALVPITRNGKREDVYWTYTYSPIDDEMAPNGVGGVLVVCTETTETVIAAQAHGRTWQVSPDLMGALNSRGYFETSNPAWKTLLGWTEEEVARMSIWELLHPDDVERTRGGFNLTQLGQPAIRFPNRYRCKDGSYRWISWVGVPEEGLVYCTGRDITEEKSAEEQLQRAQEALRQAQKMEAVGQLTGGLAHDFNNLLAAIAGSVEVIGALVKRGRVGEIDRYLTAAQNSTRRAAALTQRLLAFSRRQTLDPKATDVNRLVAGMEDLIRHTVGPSVELEVVGAGGLWLTRIDPSQLESSLLNLCINARDAMAPTGGRLTIQTENKWLDEHAARDRDLPPGQYVALCVTDTGTGMTQEVIDRAFDPFFTTKPLGEGTGLGLSMVYGFARQSGGQIRIYSQLGKGTTMCVYLPRHPGELDEADPIEMAAPAEHGHGETVLVVDDEPTVRMLIKDVLLENGYLPLEAADGPAALKLLESQVRIDLLITDVGLPGGLNGRQLADAARVARRNLRVLFITGYAENAVLGNGQLDPGMEVLTKPFVMATLGNKIRELIARSL
jgi:PAS domain S-box-containing protein